VNGKLVQRGTARAYLRMRHAAAQDGVSLYIVSGFRTMTEQRHLYFLYIHGQGNLAAKPGYSNHQSGHALDLNTSAPGVYHWLSNHAGNFDFKRTVPSEPWHWEHW
jgi:LAS superfamily LD-carboxypeptidase LdcB